MASRSASPMSIPEEPALGDPTLPLPPPPEPMPFNLDDDNTYALADLTMPPLEPVAEEQETNADTDPQDIPVVPYESVQRECPVCHQSYPILEFILHLIQAHPAFFAIWADYSYGDMLPNRITEWNVPREDEETDAWGDYEAEATYEYLLNLCETVGNHGVGVTDINEAAPIISTDRQWNAGCPICLESLDTLPTVRKIKTCQHVFCGPCIETWMTDHHHCPVCKQDADPVPEVPAEDSIANQVD